MIKAATDLIERLELTEHPEGGYYRETWRSSDRINVSGLSGFKFDSWRCAMTSILFLLPGHTFSSLHKIKGEEIWNYHEGDPAVIVEIVNGQWVETELGRGPHQKLQHVVQPGTWFGSRCLNPAGYTLCGCTVVPGFEFEDFELGGKSALIKLYPLLSTQIINYTRLP